MSSEEIPEPPVQLFVLGREFNIGPQTGPFSGTAVHRTSFNLQDQLNAAMDELTTEFDEISAGERPDWLEEGESIYDALALVSTQRYLIGRLLNQVKVKAGPWGAPPPSRSLSERIGIGEPDDVNYPIPE